MKISPLLLKSNPVHPILSPKCWISSYFILIGGLNPSEKYESVSIMKFPTEIFFNVPNHQPVYLINHDQPLLTTINHY